MVCSDSLRPRRWPNRGGGGLLRLVTVGFLLGVTAGCQAFYANTSPVPVTPPQSPAPVGVGPNPTELNMVTHPTYIIEPPDILLIDVVRMVPKPPHYLQPFDILFVRALGTSTAQPIAVQAIVDESGRIDLGPNFGSVQVAGLSVDEAKTAIEQHLSTQFDAPQVSVALASSTVAQSIAGTHIVQIDGTLNLGLYGSVYVAGLTIDQARQKIEEHLSKDLKDPQVVVSIYSYNSKKYSIITEGAGFGDNVVTRPLVGNDTVLDAIASIGGVSQLSSEEMYIARPAPNGDCMQILEVNWEDIKHGLTSTNYQLMAGDRLIIAEDPLRVVDAWVGKVTRPWERIFGSSLLGAQTLQRFEAFGNEGRR